MGRCCTNPSFYFGGNTIDDQNNLYKWRHMGFWYHRVGYTPAIRCLIHIWGGRLVE